MIPFLVAVVSFAIMLCLLVFLHEWGHFLAARFLGVRVEIFSVGFGRSIFGWKWGATEYRLSVLPFGGYVKMAGDSLFKPRKGAPDEFLSKPRWQRALIAIAGPAMNVFTTVVLFWISFWMIGLPYPAYLTRTAHVAAVASASPGSEIQAGDAILAVNGVNTPSWDAVFAEAAKAAPGSQFKLTVLRADVQTSVVVTKREDDTSYLGYPLLQPRVDSVTADTPAAKAGLKAGDLVTSVNGDPLVTWPQFLDMVRDSSTEYPMIVVLRGKKSVALHVGDIPDSQQGDDQFGASPKLKHVYHRQRFVMSAKAACMVTALLVKQIGDVFRGLFSTAISIRELQGIVGIAQQSGQAASHGPAEFVDLMALISLNLGLLNLLPLPILDGGQILILGVEGIVQRDLNLMLKQRFAQVSVIFLLALSALAMFSDIQRIMRSY
ncbi:MAG: RIP metalloprotease RseP [Candidatus Acidiferrales bacterium]